MIWPAANPENEPKMTKELSVNLLLGDIPTFAQFVDTVWVGRYNGSGSLNDMANAMAVGVSGNVDLTEEGSGSGTYTGRIIRELLKMPDMIKNFGALTFSNELKIRKPDLRIFFHTLNQLKSALCQLHACGGRAEIGCFGSKDFWYDIRPLQPKPDLLHRNPARFFRKRID
ncbi:MAG: hypothetical protein KAW52_08715 [candidate division Zixibacteria bacterium]|nr:hypothetical protein [candidate division Zixibacteria bacterium]